MFLEVSGLTVKFGKTRALDGISLSLDAGSVTVVTGNNGAGKSTLLWAISGLLLPSSGRIVFQDFNASPPAVSFLSHQHFLYEDLTVFENLSLAAALHHLEDAPHRILELMERLKMAELGQKRVSELSRGQIQRAAFARAVLPSPDLLLLDEPFSNLDAVSANLACDVIESMKSPTRAILLATHDVELCRRFSPRWVELSFGRIVESE